MLLNNSITDEGVKFLSRSCKRHPELDTIWLGGNLVSDQGVYYLCDLLRKNKRIREVNLSNKWPEEGWQESGKM
jgi:Ran GTPase-activating protein (RanGAP) involved in mRNA processing and transport